MMREPLKVIRKRLLEIEADERRRTKEIDDLRRAGRVLVGYMLTLAQGGIADPADGRKIKAAVKLFGRFG
jgi:hypothetical protein